MAESTPVNPAASGLEVRTEFVRSRHVLCARADLGDLFVDYYLHLAEHGLRLEPEHDVMFKRALAAFVLHQASRPRDELTAWTINCQAPRVNLFLTGDNATGTVAGRVFAENVKELPENLFYADVVRGNRPKQRSVVHYRGADPVAGAERLYAQSEQRRARYFRLAGDEWALFTEHPDCDFAWFDALTAGEVPALGGQETLVPLETRICRWHCGCNQQRMLEVLAPVMRQSPDELFGGEPRIEIRCPRCAARHHVTREALEAFVAERP